MAYVISQHSSKKSLEFLPEEIMLPKTNEKIVLDRYSDADYDGVYGMLKEVVEEGQTYPQDTMDKEHFENYYLSHDVFVVRDLLTKEILGSFYIKPNFPGRSSHICNAGFLVNKLHRKKGIGEIMFTKYLRIAKNLGYEGSFFNLVYSSNKGSVNLCRKLGFTEIGVIPKAGKMKGLGHVDAIQFYYDLTNLNELGEPLTK